MKVWVYNESQLNEALVKYIRRKRLAVKEIKILVDFQYSPEAEKVLCFKPSKNNPHNREEEHHGT